MRTGFVKKCTAWLLAAAMLIGLPAPAVFAAAAQDVSQSMKATFAYYQGAGGGILSGWEDLAAACIAGEDLTKYSLPPTKAGANSANSTAVLIALMKGDMAEASAFAGDMVEAGGLKPAASSYADALNLIAIEAYNRSVLSFPGAYPAIVYNRAEALSRLLASQEPDGGFGYGQGGDPDNTGLVLAALAPFKADEPAKTAIGKALAYLKKAQRDNGGFIGYSGNNANSAAAVLWGLRALGENIDANWVSAGDRTPVDALLSFQVTAGPDKGGFGVLDNGAADPYATPQAALALAQIQSGKTFFTDLTANSAHYRNLSVKAIDESGKYHEIATVRGGDTLSEAIACALQTPSVNLSEYFCYVSGNPTGGGDLSGIADGAEILAIHRNFENAAYFKTKDGDALGVNKVTVPFGASQDLTLVITSASAISSPRPLADTGVDGDGDRYADGTTDAFGNVTLDCFVEARTYDVVALVSGDFPAKTAVLPARVTMSEGGVQTAAISVRVEGVSQNVLFNPALTVGNSGGKKLTVLDAVTDALDAAGVSYDASGGYISSIDGVTGGAGGGMAWDGWNYTFAAEAYQKSGQIPPGMASQPIKDGDEIVVYYGNDDASTLFPLLDITLNADRSVTITVRAYKSVWGVAGATQIPVAGASVSWAEGAASSFTGVTNGNGQIVIPAEKAPVGKHSLQINKADQYGLPDIVRLAPGYTVEVTQSGASPGTPGARGDEVYIKVTGPSGILFAHKAFPWYRGVTPLALLAQTGLQYSVVGGVYVKELGGFAEFDYGPNSGWLYKVNGDETIKESAAVYKLNAGDELEWFYTRDYTREQGSGAWSGTSAADGAAGAGAGVTLRPAAEAVNGAAAVKLSDEDVKNAVSAAARDGVNEIIIAPAVSGVANKVSVELSAASVTGIVGGTGVKLTLSTSFGDMSVSNAGLAALAKTESGPLTLSIERGEGGLVSAAVIASGKAVQNVEGGVKLRVPAENPSAGTVALLVREDGAEEVILLSIVENGRVVALLDGSASIRIAAGSLAFDDVAADVWFRDAADFVSSRNLFRGTGQNEFSGNAPMTRGMLVTVFHRLAGSPPVSGNAFPDVADSSWYRESAQWAADNAIVDGIDGGFAGNQNITREQLAAIAMRFARARSIDMGDPAGPQTADLSGFTDRSEISAWADDAVKWAVGAGLLTGDDRRRLNAGGFAERAEVAAIMQRFVENWVKIS